MYDLTSVALPVLSGIPLRVLRWCMERKRIRQLLAPGLLASAGVTAFRKQHESCTAMAEPTFVDWPQLPLALADPEIADASSSTVDSIVRDAGALQAAYRTGLLTPIAVAQQWIALRTDPTFLRLNAFIAYDDAALLRDAAAATARFAAGAVLGELDGIPVSIKDEFAVTGYRTGGGTTFLGEGQTAVDATTVARLRAAGALIVGKGQMHEIGLGVVGTNAAYGQACNPHNVAHTAGGSSGGAAAAVASGLVCIGLGADGGGSIRIPAAFCGVYGLKPTYGRISSHGSAGLVWSMSHPGPIAATVHDVALAYVTMAGPDDADAASLRQSSVVSPRLGKRSLAGLRVGYMPAWFSHADAEIVTRCTEMLTMLRDAGATIVEIEIPHLEAARVAHTIIIITELLHGLQTALDMHAETLTDETRLSLAIAQEFDSADIAHAQQTRARCIANLRDIFADVHCIASPTSGLVAPPIHTPAKTQGVSDLGSMFEIMRFAFLANVSGLPALSMPAGTTAQGLPVGFQLMAGPWQEALLLEVASALEGSVVRQTPQLQFTYGT
jgi:Asp-tRNA(Asn)/Glu-tRNA(Gln) amidotransferase A subunit family amidase